MKTTYKDFQTAERRDHARSATRSAFGRSHCYITCPFCGDDVQAYIWSLAGGGKRCPCGAIHTNYGTSFRKSNAEPEGKR